MCINVACCADVTVTEPLLNLLQAHAIGIEQTGTTMAQIVKADTLHLVCDQKIREMFLSKAAEGGRVAADRDPESIDRLLA